MDVNRGANKIVVRLTITPQSGHILTQLSAVMGIPRGQVADTAILALGIVYNRAVNILEAKPDLAALLDTLAAQS